MPTTGQYGWIFENEKKYRHSFGDDVSLAKAAPCLIAESEVS